VHMSIKLQIKDLIENFTIHFNIKFGVAYLEK
jgi:hypothetical protein